MYMSPLRDDDPTPISYVITTVNSATVGTSPASSSPNRRRVSPTRPLSATRLLASSGGQTDCINCRSVVRECESVQQSLRAEVAQLKAQLDEKDLLISALKREQRQQSQNHSASIVTSSRGFINDSSGFGGSTSPSSFSSVKGTRRVSPPRPPDETAQQHPYGTGTPPQQHTEYRSSSATRNRESYNGGGGGGNSNTSFSSPRSQGGLGGSGAGLNMSNGLVSPPHSSPGLQALAVEYSNAASFVSDPGDVEPVALDHSGVVRYRESCRIVEDQDRYNASSSSRGAGDQPYSYTSSRSSTTITRTSQGGQDSSATALLPNPTSVTRKEWPKTYYERAGRTYRGDMSPPQGAGDLTPVGSGATRGSIASYDSGAGASGGAPTAGGGTGSGAPPPPRGKTPPPKTNPKKPPPK